MAAQPRFRKVCLVLSASFLCVVLATLTFRAAEASSEFAVSRMLQYDINKEAFGSRAVLLNAELRSRGKEGSLSRRCIVVRLFELSADLLEQLQERKAAGVLVLVPASASPSFIANWKNEESELFHHAYSIPIYFIAETPRLSEIYMLVRSQDEGNGIFSYFSSSLRAVVQTPEATPLEKTLTKNLYATLSATDTPKNKLPTIAIVAHYDSLAIAPDLSRSVDGNGSGAAALIELLRLFSKLYGDSKTRPKYNLVFVLSGGGKVGFLGTKAYLEDSDPSLDGVLCLDSIGSNGLDDMFAHVSKPPKPDTALYALHTLLQDAGAPSNINFTMIHKKIDLAQTFQNWEHEIFSIKKKPAMTLSSHQEPSSFGSSSSLLDTRDLVNVSRVSHHTAVIAHALFSYLFNISIKKGNDMPSLLNADSNHVAAWLDYFNANSRHFQDAEAVSLFLNQIKTQFKSAPHVDITIKEYAIANEEVVFYTQTKANMVLLESWNPFFEVFLLALVGAFLAALYFLFVRTSLLESILKVKAA